MGIPALTAHRCLFADGPLDGRTVLVAGGAGAVGHYAIELARRAGATVVATVSSEDKAAVARAAGAHHVVNYREDGAAARIQEAAGPVHRVVEVSPVANLELNQAVLAPNGVVASYAFDGTLSLPRDAMRQNAVFRFVLVYTMGQEAVDDAVAAVGSALADGSLTDLPYHRFPLDRIAEAHEAVERGAVGKVLVDVERSADGRDR
jgi:NADPH2:quinone reductase